MFERVLIHVVASALLLATGIGIFFAVNTTRPDTGRRWVVGTRRSRWQGYCNIGGLMSGYWVAVVLELVFLVRNGATSTPVKHFVHEVGYSGAPMTAMLGLLVGAVLGAFTNRHLPEHSLPSDPDAG